MTVCRWYREERTNHQVQKLESVLTEDGIWDTEIRIAKKDLSKFKVLRTRKIPLKTKKSVLNIYEISILITACVAVKTKQFSNR